MSARQPASDPSPPFELRILGPLEIASGARQSAIRGEKQLRLLAALIVSRGRVLSLDAILDALWGDRPPDGAIGTVQSHVSHLRRLFAGHGVPNAGARLVSRGSGYVLAVERGEVDAWRFEDLVATARAARSAGDDEHMDATLRQALSLWRGRALAEVADEPFAQPAAVALEELRLAAFEELFDAELALGRHEGILGDIDALAREHPLRERFWAQLMTALYRSGRQGEALRAYQELRHRLAEDMGIDPSPLLRDIEGMILAQSPVLEWHGPTRHSRSGGDLENHPAEVFLGREAEVHALATWLDEALLGRSRAVLVSGDAGIGKSGLLRVFAGRAAERVGRVLWGRCWEEQGAPPFWPWAEVVAAARSAPNQDGAEDPVSRLFAAAPSIPTGEGDPRVAFTADDVRLRAFQQVVSLFAEGPPTVIILEDIHEADESSLQLLRFLLPRVESAPLLLVASHRPAGDAQSPLARLLADAAREPVVRHIELAPLPDFVADRIVRATLGSDFPASEAAAIRARAEGNPFFLMELLRLVTAAAGPSSDVADLSRRGVPSGVREVVQRRLANLGDDAAHLLALASVAGASFSVPVLEAVTSMDSVRLLDSLEGAAAAGLIEEVPGCYGRYRFRHSLVRDAVYAGLSSVRRARLHGAVGRALERLGAGHSPSHLSELAYHYLVAAPDLGVDKALEYGRQAAEQAGRSLAFEEAARIYGTLLDLLHDIAAHDTRRTELAYGRAEALMRAGEVDVARDAFRRLAEDAQRRQDATLLARAALGFGQAFEAQARDEELIQLLEAALAALPSEAQAVRSRLLARLAVAQYFTAPAERRDALSQAAVETAARCEDESVLAHALSARYFALWDADHLEARQAAAEEALRLAEGIGDGELELDALTWRVMDALELGDAATAEMAMTRHAELAERLHHGRHRSYARTWEGMRALLDGRLADAEAAARHAVALGDRLSPLAQARYGAQLFFIRREQGRLAELAPEAERILDEHPELRAGWLCLVATIKLAAGNVARARELLEEVAATRDDIPFDANWLTAQVLAAELSVALGHTELAEVLQPALERYADRCAVIRFAPGCLGSVARYAGLLADVQGDLDGACRWFEQALAVNGRLRATTWVAHTQHNYAQVLARRGRRGDRARARSLHAEALGTARQLGLVALRRAIETPPRF